MSWLPLAFAFRKKKFKVIDFDIDQKKLNPWIKANLFYLIFQMPILKKMNLKNGFSSTTDFSRLKVDAIIICVPTSIKV